MSKDIDNNAILLASKSQPIWFFALIGKSIAFSAPKLALVLKLLSELHDLSPRIRTPSERKLYLANPSWRERLRNEISASSLSGFLPIHRRKAPYVDVCTGVAEDHMDRCNDAPSTIAQSILNLVEQMWIVYIDRIVLHGNHLLRVHNR
jgi:hypothetical protein